MRILPKEKYAELNGMIEAVRAQYPMKKYELSSAYNRIKVWIEDNSRSVNAEDLTDGRKYGIFTLSDMANAYIEKECRWRQYHGNIYVVLWMWVKKTRKFWCESAWGAISELDPTHAHYLIELP